MTETIGKDAQAAMTLAALSYLDSDKSSQEQQKSIEKALTQTDLPTQNKWQLVWGPHTVHENLSYIVQGPDKKFAYVARGTVPKDIKNLIEDADVGELHNLPWHHASHFSIQHQATPQISGGAVREP
ncbi:hypothetical protein [Candidatus Entotheonella palauensis]|uniref:hypothetical protein n=1 Tax=Candidatus Entotheonella palauensis TaxID=93172 RepID=UPI000B7E60DC|nr:hypothetical protein [Candidatus Entotheonella palauensis]